MLTESAEVRRVRALYESLRPEEGTEPDLAALRQAYDDMCLSLPQSADMEIEPVDAGGAPGLLVRAPGAGRERTVVWLHSGGYVIGSAHGYRALGYAVSKAADAQVLVLDYRLAPENAFPAALEDAVAAVGWAIARSGSARTVLAGDSAGGGLALATLVALRDRGLELPAGGVSCSPFADLAVTGATIQTNAEIDPAANLETLRMLGGAYLQGADATDPLASPVYADLAGLPPLLILVGTSEVLLDDSVRVADKVRAAGGDVTLEIAEGMLHIYPLFHAILPEGQKGVDQIGEFVLSRTGR